MACGDGLDLMLAVAVHGSPCMPPWRLLLLLLSAASLVLLVLPQSCVTEVVRSGLLMISSPPVNSVGRQRMREPNMSVLAGVSQWALKKPAAEE